MRTLDKLINKQTLKESEIIFDSSIVKDVADIIKSRSNLKTDTANCQHNFDAWRQMSLHAQLGNLGSEVSRSLKWYGKKQNRFQASFDRALELFDFTIECLTNDPARLKEICCAREEFCDYFLGNSWGTDPVKMMRYYDQFAILANEERQLAASSPRQQ